MKTDTQTLAQALRIMANEIESEDGVANAAIAEAAERLEDLQAQAKRLACILGSATGIVISYHEENISSEEAMNDLWQVLKKTPAQNLAEIKAQAISSALDNCPAWSVMNTYAITVEDIAEYANKIRSEANQ